MEKASRSRLSGRSRYVRWGLGKAEQQVRTFERVATLDVSARAAGCWRPSSQGEMSADGYPSAVAHVSRYADSHFRDFRCQSLRVADGENKRSSN